MQLCRIFSIFNHSKKQEATSFIVKLPPVFVFQSD